MEFRSTKRGSLQTISVALLFIFIYLACAGCENKKRDDPPPQSEKVFTSGKVTNGSDPIPGAAVVAFDASDRQTGAVVDSRLDIEIFETHYEYALIHRPKHELQAQAGIFWTNIETELVASGEGRVSVEGVPVAGEPSATSNTSNLAPLPVLGLNYRWQFIRDWYAAAGIDWFGLDLGGISGSLINWDLGIVYQTPWLLLLGLNYTSHRFDLELDTDEWLGAFQWAFRGPQFFLGARF